MSQTDMAATAAQFAVKMNVSTSQQLRISLSCIGTTPPGRRGGSAATEASQSIVFML
jgi:hypothetical protein